MKDNSKLKGIIYVLISLGFAVAGVMLLPENVVVQININGDGSNTIPRVAAVMAPLLISVVGAVPFFTGDERKQKKDKYVVYIGYICSIFMFAFNL